MFKRFSSFGAVALLALVVLTACGGGGGDDKKETPKATGPAMTVSTPAKPASATGPAGTPKGTPATSASTGSASFTITAVDIAFEPKALTIPANQDVTISVPNKGAIAHDFSIDALKIQVALPVGATEEVKINAPAGTYEYYCNVPGHKEAGMFGKLTVQ